MTTTKNGKAALYAKDVTDTLNGVVEDLNGPTSAYRHDREKVRAMEKAAEVLAARLLKKLENKQWAKDN